MTHACSRLTDSTSIVLLDSPLEAVEKLDAIVLVWEVATSGSVIAASRVSFDRGRKCHESQESEKYFRIHPSSMSNNHWGGVISPCLHFEN